MSLSDKLNSTNQYIHLSIISLLWCIPPIFMLEADKLLPAMQAAVASHGLWPFVFDLATVGLTYHLYNQLSYMTLDTLTYVAQGLCKEKKIIDMVAELSQ